MLLAQRNTCIELLVLAKKGANLAGDADECLFELGKFACFALASRHLQVAKIRLQILTAKFDVSGRTQ